MRVTVLHMYSMRWHCLLVTLDAGHEQSKKDRKNARKQVKKGLKKSMSNKKDVKRFMKQYFSSSD